MKQRVLPLLSAAVLLSASFATSASATAFAKGGGSSGGYGGSSGGYGGSSGGYGGSSGGYGGSSGGYGGSSGGYGGSSGGHGGSSGGHGGGGEDCNPPPPPGVVPEPSTWALMLMGFGLIGGAMRRKGRMEKNRALA